MRFAEGGTNPVKQPETYGAKRISGARFGAVNWKDASGNVWLFGGLGDDSVGTTSGDFERSGEASTVTIF